MWPGPRSRQRPGRGAHGLKVFYWTLGLLGLPVGQGAQVICGAAHLKSQGDGPSGVPGQIPTPGAPVSTKHVLGPLVLGQGLRSETIRVSGGWHSFHHAHPAAPSALVTTQVGLRAYAREWPGAEGRPLSAWSQPCRR